MKRRKRQQRGWQTVVTKFIDVLTTQFEKELKTRAQCLKAAAEWAIPNYLKEAGLPDFPFVLEEDSLRFLTAGLSEDSKMPEGGPFFCYKGRYGEFEYALALYEGSDVADTAMELARMKDGKTEFFRNGEWVGFMQAPDWRKIQEDIEAMKTNCGNE